MGIQSFRTHGSFVPRRFVPRLRRFVPTFDQFVPNPLVDSYPTNYDTKCLKQTLTFISFILVIAKRLKCTLARARYMCDLICYYLDRTLRTFESTREMFSTFPSCSQMLIVLYHSFSNSLIIYAALTQPEHLILVRRMGLETQ